MATRGSPRKRFHNVKLIAVAADGTAMELHRYEPGWHLSPGTKAFKGICSACYCEEAASFLTERSGRHWAMCWGHAQVYANGTSYWGPGMPIPEAT